MKFRLLFFILLFSYACVERFNLPPFSMTPALVVDGLITDQPGPYTVKLSWTSGLDKDFADPEYISGASLRIEDNLGNTEVLQETRAGHYQTDGNGLQGVVGRKYKLFITTPDNNQYESDLVEMHPPGTIENLYTEFMENSMNPNDLTKPQDALWVYIDSKGTEDGSNLMRWRWNGIYHNKTYPELHTKRIGTAVIPDPLPCSGYIVRESSIVRTDTCGCCDCWVPQFSSTAMLSDNAFGMNEFNRVLIAKIPIDSRLFYEKYYLEVEQLSLSGDAYEFWKLLKTQESGSSSIFQPNIVKVRGNLHGVSPQSKEVYGVFSVSAVVSRSIFMKRNDLPKQIPLIDTTTVDCRNYNPGATNQKPPFW